MPPLRFPLKLLLLVVFMPVMGGCGSHGNTSICTVNCGGSSSAEFLYGSPGDSLLNTFLTAEIDLGTGGFSSVSVTTVPFLNSHGIVAVNARFLYISWSSDIYGYSINPSTGALTSLTGSPFPMPSGRSPQGLAATTDGKFLYGADAAGGIDAFQVDNATGKLSLVPSSPFGSGANYQVAVDPSGSSLYATDYADDKVLGFTIASTGALAPVQSSPFALPGQGVGKPLGIVDTGGFLYVSLSGSNQIAGFSIDSQTGLLTAIPGSPFAAGDLPAVLVRSGSFLYAANENDGNISGYRIDSTSGALTQISGSPFLSGKSAQDIAIDSSGKYLFVSESIGIIGCDIDASSGTLTQNATSVSNDGALWMTVVQPPSSAAQPN